MFKPLHNYVLIERIEEENKTAGGITIPDNAKEKPLTGIIKAVGKKAQEEFPTLKESQVVVFEKYKGSEIKLDGKEFVVLEAEDILGILEK